MEKEIIQLEQKVKELKAWKEARIYERLNLPVDSISRKVLQKGHLVFTGQVKPVITNVITDFLVLGLGVSVNNEKRFLFTTTPLNAFTVDAGSDTITNVSGSHNLQNGDIVALTSTDTLPAGLDNITLYYVVERTGTTFKVSETEGGLAIDITDGGLGTHYWGKNIL